MNQKEKGENKQKIVNNGKIRRDSQGEYNNSVYKSTGNCKKLLQKPYQVNIWPHKISLVSEIDVVQFSVDLKNTTLRLMMK